jgi:hypothetical protein
MYTLSLALVQKLGPVSVAQNWAQICSRDTFGGAKSLK